MSEKPILFNAEMVRAILDGRKTQTRRIVNTNKNKETVLGVAGYCPYGERGDYLWVRETFGFQVRSYGGGTGEYIVYKADNPNAIKYATACGKKVPVAWKPSIHMPRSFSRINLEIISIRVDRLQDITEEDAVSEGIERDSDGWIDYQMPSTQCCQSAKESYCSLWESINGLGSWGINPLVWVIDFNPLVVNG